MRRIVTACFSRAKNAQKLHRNRLSLKIPNGGYMNGVFRVISLTYKITL